MTASLQFNWRCVTVPAKTQQERYPMKAMLLSETAPIEQSPLALTEIPDPTPGPGEVRVAVRCCAICRTDLHIIEGDLPAIKRPIVPGHQIVGTVDALGPKCSRLRIGMRVGIA